MSYPRIQKQFNKLFDTYDGKEASVTLEHLATIFNCTKRNARIVINKMHTLGWLSWHPEAGRGKQSRIVFLVDKDSVKHLKVMDLINEGKLDLALESLDFDHDAFSSLVSEQFGIQNRDGKRLSRYPFSRPINRLLPNSRLPASEQYLLRKISCGLVKFDQKSQKIVPDLAYDWTMLSTTHWRFFIRPSVYLHDENKLQMQQLANWLETLTQQPYFTHISRISFDETSHCIDIWLNKADLQFISILCSYHALFYLQEDNKIISCGAYKIEEHNPQQLKLSAFPLYFGEKPLLDEEEIWSMPENIKPKAPSHLPISADDRKKLVAGCYYLVLKNNAQGLKQYLFPVDLLNRMAKNLSYQNIFIPAYGLLPEYHYNPTTHIYTTSALIKPLKLTMAIISNDPLHKLIASTIQRLLSKKNIQLNIIENNFDMHMRVQKNSNDVDIWLMEMELENKREEDLLTWIYENEHLKPTLDISIWENLETELDQWRNGEITFPSETTMQSFIESGKVIPLFHEWS